MSEKAQFIKTSNKLRLIEVLTGLLAIIMGIVTFYPFKLFGIRGGGIIFSFSIMLLGSTLLIIGGFRLASSILHELTGLAKLINIVTSALIIAVTIIILFFQMVVAGQIWIRLLFGIGFLGYAIGRIAFGALANEYSSGLRVFIGLLGSAIAIISVIILEIRIHIGNFTLGYGNFITLALIIIGLDCLISAIAFEKKELKPIEAAKNEF